MPQLDLFTYFVQVFWCYFGFLVLYFSLKYYVLAPIAKVLKLRQKLLTITKKNSIPKINTIFW